MARQVDPHSSSAFALTLVAERELRTHDIALSIPHTSSPQEKPMFLLILLSPHDLKTDSLSTTRIERLQLQSGGKNVGIVFLLQERNSATSRDGTIELMNLQMSLQGSYTMPITPLHNVDALATTLINFQRNFCAHHTPSIQNPAVTLLPYCTTAYPSLPEHSVWALTDLCKSIPSLAEAATTEEGQAVVRNILSDQGQAAESFIEFWKHEVFL